MGRVIMSQGIPADVHRSSRNGALASARNAEKVCIEGEYVTRAQIADRIGVCREKAGTRLRRERGRAGPVTWAGLARTGSKRD